MKSFAVELKRTSYVTVYVDAETKEQAEDKVWDDTEYGAYDDGDASWECSDVYEQFATDGSRSNGTRSVPLKTLGQLEADNSDGFRNPDDDTPVLRLSGTLKTLEQLEAESTDGFRNPESN